MFCKMSLFGSFHPFFLVNILVCGLRTQRTDTEPVLINGRDLSGYSRFNYQTN